MTVTEMRKVDPGSAATLTRENPLSRVRPPVDVFENEHEILLVADLPGVRSEDLHVRLEDSELTLEGRFDSELSASAGEAKLLSQEFRPLQYARSFVVPEGIDPNLIRARAENGVVSIHLPKAEAFKPRDIEIQFS